MGWDFLGHEWASHLLQQHIAQGEIRHAYLFTGPPGVGRRSMALRFSQAMNCTNPPAPGEPCRACRVCKNIDRMQHTDLSVVQLAEGKTEILIDQIRTLQHTLSLSPYESRFRVALLLRFELANANAQNALLKTLEEAPEKVVLLLTASSAENLLPTIASRCELLRLRPMPVDQLEVSLADRFAMTPEEARLLAHLSGGRAGYALNLHGDPSALELRRNFVEDFLRLLPASRRERFAHAERFMKKNEKKPDRGRQEMRQLFQVWESMWRDIFLAASGATAPLTNLDFEESIRRVAPRIGMGEARARLQDIETSLDRHEANVNQRMLLETLLLDWSRVAL
jgi:DNA polymerase-3 subunit delta'